MAALPDNFICLPIKIGDKFYALSDYWELEVSEETCTAITISKNIDGEYYFALATSAPRLYYYGINAFRTKEEVLNSERYKQTIESFSKYLERYKQAIESFNWCDKGIKNEQKEDK